MIVGFVILGGFIIYLIVSILIIVLSARVAQKRGKSGWKGALIASVVMYLLLFWDQIPTHATHKYLCMTQGGVTLNKTLKEWKQENPGVSDMLNPDPKASQEKYLEKIEGSRRIYKLPDNSELIAHYYPNRIDYMYTDMKRSNGTKLYWLNQRFGWETQTSKHLFGIRKREEQIVDLTTGEVMARYVDFDTDQNPKNPKRFRDFKIWIQSETCEESDERKTKPNKFKFNKLMHLFQYQKEFKE